MKLKNLTLLVCLASAQPALANIDIQFDYTYDSNSFFADQARRDVLEAAASIFESRFTDSLTTITSGGGNDFSISTFNPSNPFNSLADINLSNQSFGSDVIYVYAGGADLGSALGIGGPGGFSCSGFGSFCSDASQRGQGETQNVYDGFGNLILNAIDVAPWGGSITFDTLSSWNFSVSNGPEFSEFDFYSVAVHELGHLLGFGTTDSYYNLISGSIFIGPTTGSVPVYDPINDGGHWAPGTMSTVNGNPQEAAMDPDIANGQRKHFTDLDFAAMKDIGWQVAPVPEADTWAMLLAGLGMVGFAARRRVRQIA